MSNRTCTTQTDLDAAVAAGDYPILTGDGEFTIPAGCIEVGVEGSSQPRIDAWDSSQPRIVARGSSQPRIDAWGSSQPRIVARGSSQPRIVAWGSSQPRIDAWDSSQLQMRSDKPRTITGHSRKAVVTRDKNVTVTGDIGFEVEVEEISDPIEWLTYYAVPVAEDGTAVLFKRVDDNWRSRYGTSYAPGETPGADDWHTQSVCGGGLHLSPHPFLTEKYSEGPRLVAVRVVAADLVPIPDIDSDVADKCKVASCVVLYECDEEGVEVSVVEAVSA